jgi:hypothetical protein
MDEGHKLRIEQQVEPSQTPTPAATATMAKMKKSTISMADLSSYC